MRQNRLDVRRRRGIREHLVHEPERVRLQLFRRNAHAQAEFRIVLEERVGPCRTASVRALAVGRRGQVAAVDGGAPRRVGDQQPVAADLRQELDVGRLAAPCAGPRELEERTLQLAVQKHLHVELGGVHFRQLQEEVPVLDFLLAHRKLRHHLQRRLRVRLQFACRRILLRLRHRALDHAQRAAHAVLRRALHRHLLAQPLHLRRLGVRRLEVRRRTGERVLAVDFQADRRVRADRRAVAALDADRRIPLRHERRDVALLPLRGRRRPGAVRRDGGNRQVVALLRDHLRRHVLDECGGFRRDGRRLLERARRLGRILHLLDRGDRRVDALPVLLDDVHALHGVGLLGVRLEFLDGFRFRQDARELEEGGLEHRVRARAHAVGARDLGRVHDIEAQFLVDDRLLHLVRHVRPDFRGGIGRGQQERRARLRRGEHVVLLEVVEAVARREVRLVAEVGAADDVRPEPQMGDGHAAGLLGVVLEVALGVVVGVGADDLDGVLVRAHRAVRADAPEHALLARPGRDLEALVPEQIPPRHVVHDAHGEMVDRLCGGHVVVDRLAHLRREVLGPQPVASAQDPRLRKRRGTRLHPLRHRGAHVQIERIAHRARLFRAVEHRDGLHRLRQRRDERVRGERTVQANLDEADLLAGGDKRLDRLVQRLAAGAHRHDDAFGVRCAHVVEEVVAAPRERGQLVHARLHDGRRRLVVLLAALAPLEVHVRILRRAPHGRVFRVERPPAEVRHGFLVDHLADRLIVYLVDLLHFVGRAETVEEMQERHARVQRRPVRDKRQILRFLHRVGREDGEPRLPARHDVPLVAENAQALAGQRTRRDVEDRRGELARDLVHVRDHQQKALRRREGRRERTRRDGPVHRARRAAFGLHLHNRRRRPPDVLAPERGELVARLRHRRGRGDRINRRDFRTRESHLRNSRVAVYRYLVCHVKSPLV